jgi:predicted esterase
MVDAVGVNPHLGTPTITYGAPLEEATAAAIFLHGRGATPEDILYLAHEADPGGIAYLAPEAAGGSWYPLSFLAPLEANQPWLDSAFERIGDLIAKIEAAGIPAERIVLAGFSQGACLALEYAVRKPRCYGGLVGLSGGLIGPDDMPRDYPGSLEGTPVFLGCSDMDPYIPLERVRMSGEVLRRLGAQVDERIYPALGHLVNEDELDALASMLKQLSSDS